MHKRHRSEILAVALLMIAFGLLAFALAGHVLSRGERVAYSAPLSSYQTLTYTEWISDVVNPERGFRYSFDDLDPNLNYSYFRSQGASLIYAYLLLDNYRTSPIPSTALQRLQNALDAVRSAGLKVILRVAYNFGPYPNSEPDAPLPWIITHTQQLSPVLHANADVIAWMHAGFIGAWGEWHSSTNGLHLDPNAKWQVLNALAAALPADRFIQLRYPADIIAFFPTPLNASDAFNGALQARVGFHNDCFLSSDTDYGTYLDPTHRLTTTNYLAQMSQFVPTGGETCALYTTLQNCTVAIREMERLHWTDLNLSYHPDVIQYWRNQGCFETIRKRLGYRLVLQRATFPVTASVHQAITVTWTLSNQGFAAPLNPRPVYLVLSSTAVVHRVLLPHVDPRRWLPGTHTVTVSVTLPSTLPATSYALALWLPDPYPRLQGDPRYSVRFANHNVWDEARGWNRLGQITLTNPLTHSAFLPLLRR